MGILDDAVIHAAVDLLFGGSGYSNDFAYDLHRAQMANSQAMANEAVAKHIASAKAQTLTVRVIEPEVLLLGWDGE